jgi:hypothetical protein
MSLVRIPIEETKRRCPSREAFSGDDAQNHDPGGRDHGPRDRPTQHKVAADRRRAWTGFASSIFSTMLDAIRTAIVASHERGGGQF